MGRLSVSRFDSLKSPSSSDVMVLERSVFAS